MESILFITTNIFLFIITYQILFTFRLFVKVPHLDEVFARASMDGLVMAPIVLPLTTVLPLRVDFVIRTPSVSS